MKRRSQPSCCFSSAPQITSVPFTRRDGAALASLVARSLQRSLWTDPSKNYVPLHIIDPDCSFRMPSGLCKHEAVLHRIRPTPRIFLLSWSRPPPLPVPNVCSLRGPQLYSARVLVMNSKGTLRRLLWASPCLPPFLNGDFLALGQLQEWRLGQQRRCSHFFGTLDSTEH